MLNKILTLFFECPHPNCSWPMTKNEITYRVCLDCGLERKYNWKEMKFEKLTPVEVIRVRGRYGKVCLY